MVVGSWRREREEGVEGEEGADEGCALLGEVGWERFDEWLLDDGEETSVP